MALEFGDDPRSWNDLVDFATDLGHADWRNEILSFLLYPPGQSPEPRQEQVVFPLRPAV